MIKQRPYKNPAVSFKSPIIVDSAEQTLFFLSQDGMPCLAPDTAEIVAIPNTGVAYQFPLVGRMPGVKNKKSLLNLELSK